MRPADKMEKRINTMEFKASAAMHDRILTDVLDAHDKSKNIKSAVMQPNVWRIIMKTRIAKVAAAAAIIVAVGLTLTVFDKSLSSAYAIEQTIEAMRSIDSVHAYCTDWDNSKGETWVQIDPETGQEEYYYADQGNLLIVGTPLVTYYYYKDKNLVRIRDEYVPASEVRISRFFEDMVRWIQQYHGELWFYFEFDEDIQQEVIMVHGSIPSQGDIEEKEFVVRVDPRTKLPISLEAIKCGAGEGVKSVDRVEYNVAIPEGIFEFTTPDGAKVVHEKKDGEGS
jgi:outer membrane lipoprotein-sorting protein